MGHSRFLCKRFAFTASVALLTLFCTFLHVSAEGQDLAARRAARMNAGINLSGWFTGSEYSAEHIQAFTTAQDLKLIHDMGFQSVRLCFNPAAYQRLPVHGPQRAEALIPLHRAVEMILANGLNVTVTVFPEDAYKQDLFAGDGKVEEFIRMWRELAASFASSDPERVFFEIMNEPEQPDEYRWIGIEARAVQAIRAVAPAHTIIATGAHYSGLEDLLRTEPLHDPNVVYAFHFYEPFLFTHQGATWTGTEVIDLQDIPYPSDPAAVASLLPQVTENATRLRLFDYGNQRWDATVLNQRVAFASAWGRKHNVPVICNEFGAYRDTVVPAARARFLRDVRLAMESNGIPWSMWDYRGDFGVVDRTPTIIRPDDLVLKSLGRTSGIPPVQLGSSK